MISWDEKLNIFYKFQKQQELKICLFEDRGNQRLVLGVLFVQICKILNPVNDFKFFDQNNHQIGFLKIECNECADSKKKINLVLAGKNLADLDIFSKSDPFLKIFRKNEKSDYCKIYETTVVMDNLNPVWEPIVMEYSHFCNCNTSTIIKVECYDFDCEAFSELIGRCEFAVSDVAPGQQFTFTNPNKVEMGCEKITGYLLVNEYILVEEGSFIDYLRQGMNLNLAVAIDYTTSNGIINDASSLHHIKEGELNEYESAIGLFGSILNDYDSDKRYPVFGFGGEPNGSNEVSHAFPLTGDPLNPYVNGYESILEIYRRTMPEIKLSGPTYFSEILRAQISIIQNSGPNNYHILLILTDGDIHDYNETVNLIVRASELPLSILIVGIGWENFLQLKKLDGDKKHLVSADGKKCKRDIVQFIPFRYYANNLTELAREALTEIPGQLLTYMKMNSR